MRTADLVSELRPLLVHFRDARQEGESFGDFCQRLGTPALIALADSHLAGQAEVTNAIA